jgi:hypothetical protein
VAGDRKRIRRRNYFSLDNFMENSHKQNNLSDTWEEDSVCDK